MTTRASVRRILFAATLLACVPLPATQAAKVEGFGSLTSNAAPVQTDTEYAHPRFLDVAKLVQLNSVQAGTGGHAAMLYTGQAQFGRLAATSFVSGKHANVPDLAVGSDIAMWFQDTIMAQNPSPLVSSYLRLDVDLSGSMSRGDQIFGNSTDARFGITQISTTDPEKFIHVAGIEFSWFGENRAITSETGNNSGTLGFVPYPGGEPAFEPDPLPGPPTYSFRAHGYVDVPLNFTLGPTFLLEFALAAYAGTNTDNTFAETNFGSTALIGNARIVNAAGNIIAGASFSSESGYDYITPPPALPEPQSAMVLLAGLGVSGLVTRRRRRIATA
jgi:hypothetical protein